MSEPDLYAALLNNTIDVDIEGIDKKTGAGFLHTWQRSMDKK